MKKRCDKCRYWVPQMEYREGERLHDGTHPDDYIGKCHRYPPQLDSVYAGKCEDRNGEGCEAVVTCWYQPLTEGNGWCGEFKKTKKALDDEAKNA